MGGKAKKVIRSTYKCMDGLSVVAVFTLVVLTQEVTMINWKKKQEKDTLGPVRC